LGAAGIAAVPGTIIDVIGALCICGAVGAGSINTNQILLLDGNTINKASATLNASIVFTNAQRIYAAKVVGFTALVIAGTDVADFINTDVIESGVTLGHAFAARQAGVVFAVMLVAVLGIADTVSTILTGPAQAVFIAEQEAATGSVRRAHARHTKVFNAHTVSGILGNAFVAAFTTPALMQFTDLTVKTIGGIITAAGDAGGFNAVGVFRALVIGCAGSATAVTQACSGNTWMIHVTGAAGPVGKTGQFAALTFCLTGGALAVVAITTGPAILGRGAFSAYMFFSTD